MLYRLFHQGLADHLRSQPSDLPDVIERQVFERLLTTVGTTRDGRRRWDTAMPYLLRHAPDHAARADRLDTLLADAGFLVHADPSYLITLHRATGTAAVAAAGVYRASYNRHRQVTAVEPRSILAV